MKFILASLLLLSFSFAHGAVLTTVVSTAKLNGVVLNTSATTQVDGQPVALTPTGAGLRTKTVAKIKVYVAQLYVSNIDKFRDPSLTPLGALDFPEMKAVAIQLSVLHTVSADQMTSAFQDGLAANKVDANQKEYQDFIDGVASTGEFKIANGTQTATLIGERLSDGTEEIIYENSETQQVRTLPGPRGFIKNIFSIWLGTPADSGLAALQKPLIGSVAETSGN